jgi:hypothetical protein
MSDLLVCWLTLVPLLLPLSCWLIWYWVLGFLFAGSVLVSVTDCAVPLLVVGLLDLSFLAGLFVCFWIWDYAALSGWLLVWVLLLPLFVCSPLWCVGTPYCLVCGWLVGFSLWFWTPSCCLAACADAYCLLSLVCCCLLVYFLLPLSIFGLGYYGYSLPGCLVRCGLLNYDCWAIDIWTKEFNTKEKLGWK